MKWTLILVAFALIASGCNKETAEKPNKAPAAKPEAAKPEAAKPEAAKPEAAKPEAAKPEAAKPEVAKAGADGMITPTAEGIKLDPPVKKSAVPAGSWICDMGTVHYARSEQGDGVCPICKMKLVAHEHEKSE